MQLLRLNVSSERNKALAGLAATFVALVAIISLLGRVWIVLIVAPLA